MTTLKLEIAGLTIHYKNAPDLTDKVQATLQGLKEQRTSFESQAKDLRAKERELERFLGVAENPKPALLNKEENSHA